MNKKITKEQIKDRLIVLAEPQYAAFSKKLLPGLEKELMGVRLPALRKIAKEIAEADGETYLKTGIDETTFEECMLWGMVLGYIRTDIQTLKAYLRTFLPNVDNWSVCDSLCSGLKITEKNQKEMLEFIKECIGDGRVYHVRFGVVMLLNYYRQEKYLEESLSILDSVKSEEYYVNMAVAWALSMYYISFPQTVQSYLQSCSLDEFTYRKTLSKILESKQITPLMREDMKKMREYARQRES